MNEEEAEKLQPGDVVIVDIDKAARGDERNVAFFDVLWPEERMMQGIVKKEPERPLVYHGGVMIEISKDEITNSQWTGVDAIHPACNKGHAQLVYHDRKEEYICPFCSQT